MSAFVVEDRCINSLVAFLSTAQASRSGMLCMLCMLRLDGLGRLDVYGNRQELAHRMMEMNLSAVNARYSERTAVAMHYAEMSAPTPIQALKSLSCFLYQCAEGDVPETNPLYAQLREVETALLHVIVSHLPEYQAAKWG